MVAERAYAQNSPTGSTLQLPEVPWKDLEPATRIERATSHRFDPETCLTDSYKGGQPPCMIPTKVTYPLRIPFRSLVQFLFCGAGDWNRTSDLRFTKPLLYQLSYAGTLVRRKEDWTRSCPA